MLTTVYGVVGVVILVAVCLFAGVRGGPAERYAAAVAAMGWAATLALQAVSGVKDPLLGFAGIDVTAFFALIGLVWRSRRLWPLAAVACQGLAVAVDMVRFDQPHMNGWGYLTGLAIAGYGLLASIVFGVFTAEREPSPGH